MLVILLGLEMINNGDDIKNQNWSFTLPVVLVYPTPLFIGCHNQLFQLLTNHDEKKNQTEVEMATLSAVKKEVKDSCNLNLNIL